MRRGWVFTLDAAIGMCALFLFLGIVILLKQGTSFERVSSFQLLSYQARDMVDFLSTVKAKEFDDTPTIRRLLQRGVLTEEDLQEKSLLDLIGSFWYGGNHSIAANITGEVLENFTSYCFSLQTENQTIYSNCNDTGKIIAVASCLASGYEVGKPVSGYIARAWATKVTKNTTKIIPFLPEGSGWTGRRFEVTKNFTLPENITIYDAKLYVSAHLGDSQENAEFEHLTVNGVEKKDEIVWLYLQEESWRETTAVYGYANVTEELRPGNNSIYVSIKTPNYHSHLHPGMRLVVTYSLTYDLYSSNRTVKKRFYFDNVVGRTGAWATLSFYIPEGAKNVSGRLHLNLKHVDDTRVWWWDTEDIRVYVNSDEPFYRDASSTWCYFFAEGGYYCVRDFAGESDRVLDFDITSELVNGTNVVSVYVNCYGDYHWGRRNATIYSSPLRDPNGSSYVEISYTLDKPPILYGEIDITKELIFGGDAENPKQFDFNLTERESEVSESFVHIAQGFSSMIRTYAWFDNESETLVFESPAVRAVPENVYIPPSIWGVGENHVKLEDVQPGGSLSSTNYILPWSSLEYTYKVKGIVGYGEVFNSSSLAIQDAIQRLLNQTGEIGLENVKYDTKAVHGIKWLWGPSLFKVLVWERG